MIGTHIGSQKNWILVQIALSSMFGAVIFGALFGPKVLIIISAFSLLVTISAGWQYFKNKSGSPHILWAVIPLIINVFLIILGVFLILLFQTSLTKNQLTMPKLVKSWDIQELGIKFLAPQDWIVSVETLGQERIVVLKPQNFNQFAGVIDMRIALRPLPKTGKQSTEQLLEKMAMSFSPSYKEITSKNREIQIHTEKTTLLSETQGIWTELDIKKRWINLRQTMLIGVKNKQIIMVTAVGLKEHSLLARILCMGLFESISPLK